jgi:hypothetical protein
MTDRVSGEDAARHALLTSEIRGRLEANRSDPEGDHVPVVKFFNPVGEGMWLAVSICEDGDAMFGMADLGFGCPEAGYFSLHELTYLRLPFGIGIERDILFETTTPLSAWLDIALDAASLREAERMIGRVERASLGQ